MFFEEKQIFGCVDNVFAHKHTSKNVSQLVQDFKKSEQHFVAQTKLRFLSSQSQNSKQ